MYKETSAALGGIAIDVAALCAATTVETAEAACHFSHIASGCVNHLSGVGRDACIRASDRVAAWRLARKQRLKDWAADTGEVPDSETQLA